MKKKLAFIFFLALSLLMAGGFPGGELAGSAEAKGKPHAAPTEYSDEGGDEELGNNLSIPTVYIGQIGVGVPSPRAQSGAAPEGAQSTEYLGYWLQGTAATWSAEYREVTGNDIGVTVTAEPIWGDNISGIAPMHILKHGTPIRVEVVLQVTGIEGSGEGSPSWPTWDSWTGYEVTKLTDELDRYATYGTDGTTTEGGTRMWVGNTYLIITNNNTGEEEYNGTISAEINSMGGIVYGYLWGIDTSELPDPGEYTLNFLALDDDRFEIQGGQIVNGDIESEKVILDGSGAESFYSCTLLVEIDESNRGGSSTHENGNSPKWS